MSPRYDTVLFDLDGTLTDSAPGILNAVRHALHRARAPVPDAATLNKFIGPPLIDAFEQYCGFTHAKAVQALADYRVYFKGSGLFENSVYPGVVELLEGLTAHDVRCVVATSKPEPFARQILEHFDLTRHFTAIHGATLDERRNQKDEVIAWALSHSGELGRVLMVGDRAQDVAGARANGLDVVGALWGYGSRAELADATALAASPVDVLDFVVLT